MIQAKTLLKIAAPLLGIFILVNGLGALATFIPIQIHAGGGSAFDVGMITGAYYLGMALGAFRNANLILRIGHIRAFSAFAALITVAILSMGLSYSLILWCLLRGLSGYCLAGLYIVIESWILKESTVKTRGVCLALYMIAIYGASASGQFLLNIGSVTSSLLFTIAAILAALSIVPLATTRAGNPEIETPSALNIIDLFRLSPSGLVSCTCSGLMFGVISAFVPLYLRTILTDLSETAFVMFLVLMGGVLLQYPVGWLSDQFDRRKMLMILCAIIIAIGCAFIAIPQQSGLFLYALMFLFGGVSFSLYPVSMSHTCDVLDPNAIVSATQGLMLSYGVGAVLGPLIAPIFQSFFGYIGVFIYFNVACASLFIYLLSRLFMQKPHTNDEQHSFVPMPNTTPIAAELDPRADS